MTKPHSKRKGTRPLRLRWEAEESFEVIPVSAPRGRPWPLPNYKLLAHPTTGGLTVQYPQVRNS